MIEKFAFREEPGEPESQFFAEHGYLYVERFYDVETEIDPIRKDIFELIELISAQKNVSLGLRSYSATDFDVGLQQLLMNDRSAVGILYDATKKLPNYVRTACLSKHDRYCRSMLRSEFVGFANRGFGIRMDNPFEDEYSTQAHQDYVSQLCSQNAVVTWSPLRHVSSDLGPMKIYPGSHRSGVFPIVKEKHGSRGLVIANLDEVKRRYNEEAPEVAVGDCLFLHFLTLHESGKNRSNKTRWSMLSRYFDFTDQTGRAIDWKGGLQEGHSFETVHPELSSVQAGA